MPETIIKRRKRDTDQISLTIEVQRTRHFLFSIPDGIPYDDKDADRIIDELMEIDPKPDEVQGPVADGLGGLVSSTFAVSITDSKCEDWEIMLEIEEAVKRGLTNRAFRDRS